MVKIKKEVREGSALTQEKIVGAGEFKTHCLRLIDEVNKTKQPIIVTKHGKPLAQLIPIADEEYSLYGCMKGTVEILGDIVEGTGEIWEADA